MAAALLGISPLLTPALMTTPAYAAEASKLGDLSKFRTIASDTLALINKNNRADAKARIKDLETSWDNAEAGLKPRAAKDWHHVDKAIDGALTAVRNDKSSQAECQKALNDLLVAMDHPAA